MGLIGFVIKWIFLIFVAILLLIAGGLVYVYYFYTFKTVRICLPEQAIDTNLTCSSNQDCMNMFKTGAREMQDVETQISTAPEFMKTLINSATNASILCESTCKIRQMNENAIRGISGPNLYCNAGEIEVAKVNVHGKELIQFFKYSRTNPQFFKGA